MMMKNLNVLHTKQEKPEIDDLTKMLTPVYAKYLTLADLKELIESYKSPIGKKLA